MTTQSASLDLWHGTHDESELAFVAGTIAAILRKEPSFCLWLQGPLGAGKTTLTGAILRVLGLDPRLPVTSPTYTYMNEYRIGDRWFAHLDLYRAGPGFSTEELGLLDARPFQGIFVEWPERAPKDPGLSPSHILTITFADDAKGRTYSLRRPDATNPRPT